MFHSIEDVSHLIPYEEFCSHYSQKGTRAKVRILFAVKADEEEGNRNPIKIRFIQIPSGYPSYRIRPLMKQVESQLRETYDVAYRINVCYIKHEEAESWTMYDGLPLNGFVFI